MCRKSGLVLEHKGSKDPFTLASGSLSLSGFGCWEVQENICVDRAMGHWESHRSYPMQARCLRGGHIYGSPSRSCRRSRKTRQRTANRWITETSDRFGCRCYLSFCFSLRLAALVPHQMHSTASIVIHLSIASDEQVRIYWIRAQRGPSGLAFDVHREAKMRGKLNDRSGHPGWKYHSTCL